MLLFQGGYDFVKIRYLFGFENFTNIRNPFDVLGQALTFIYYLHRLQIKINTNNQCYNHTPFLFFFLIRFYYGPRLLLITPKTNICWLCQQRKKIKIKGTESVGFNARFRIIVSGKQKSKCSRP